MPPATDTPAASPSAEAFAARCDEGLQRAKALLPTIIDVSGPRTLENTLEPYNDMLMHAERTAGLAGLMSSVHPDEDIREAARASEQAVDAFMSGLGRDRRLYEAIAELAKSPAHDSFDAETQRLIERGLRDFHRSGVDRDEATRERLREIDDELTKLGQAFQKAVNDDVRHVEVKDVSELAGLPEDFVRAHPPQEDGRIRISTDYPDYLPVMAYAENGDLRRALYVCYKARGGAANEATLKQILVLRAEKAKLLGYESWADYATENKMMKSGANAAAFIDRVAKIARPRAERDYQELLARKRKQHPDAQGVDDFEKYFYESKVKTESYAFDPQSVRPYFEYRRVERGLLDITARIYDIAYEPVAPEQVAELWHPDVKVFDVTREGEVLGRIFLDMHPRESKYKQAAQFPYRSGVRGKQLPEGVLVCNFPNPRTTDGPALMEHPDVVTMFHEFGHLMHHVLGGHKRWIEQSGVATEWDFVEAPSQMFEEWAWSHETLATFALHHETGEPLPEETVQRMRRADTFGLGLNTMQQMFYASISLEFHTVAPEELDMNAAVQRLQSAYTPFPFVEGTCFHANFGHLNGYSALYYTYMWSLVIAKDLLTPFKEHGLLNLEWTHRYRDHVLAPGGSKDAAVLVEEFLGRTYKFDAFEAYLAG